MSIFISVWNRDGKPIDDEIPYNIIGAEINPSSDGEDIWLKDSVLLGHQHFWITPEEVGERQPVVDELTGCVVTCSTRLDNRTEIFRTLGLEGNVTKSISDSNLILMAYSRWGLECPKHLLGDFAFVIWDPGKQRFFAVRDPLGAQELVYCITPKMMILASSISMILHHPEVEPELNECMVAKYLALNYGDEASTFYESIFHLPPAHFLIVDQKSFSLQRYWDVDPTKRIKYSRTTEYAEHYRELISNAIRCRMRSAYPVGVSLSGGLDSSTLTCGAAGLAPNLNMPQKDIGCYSYIFDLLPDCDERVYFKSVVEQAAHFFPVQPMMLNGDDLFPQPFSEDWRLIQDYPYQDPYFYLLRAILTAARQNNARILFNGFYGDELYSGNEYLFADLFLEMRWASAIKILRHYQPFISIKHDLIDYGLRGMVPPVVKRFYRFLFPISPAWKQWVTSQLYSRFDQNVLSTPLHASPRYRQPGRQKRYDALFFTGYPTSITTYHQIARAYGMEYQFPYFDRLIVEFLLALPADQIFLPGYNRKILRDSMIGKLPESVRNRQGKTGLSKLYEKGIYQKNWSQIETVFSHSQVIERGWIRKDWLTGEISQDTRTRDGYVFWLVLSLEIWMQRYWA